MNLRLYELLKTIVNMVLSVITFFLVTRIVLRFFSTNPSTPFVGWVFDISSFLMQPFANIAPNIITQTGVLDIVATVSLLAYLIAGYFLLSLIERLMVPEVIEEDDSAIVHYHDLPRIRSYKRSRTRRDYIKI